ncbi:MAG: succinylglutamate desuccinylase/aspartoacylase family protein [Vicingaceae bacterium]
MKNIEIDGTVVKPGESAQINISVAKLPTRTTIEIPVIVSRSEVEGPTLLLMGGLHGDEINGVEIVRRILVNAFNKPLVGSTICIPIVNIYGFIQSTRQVPGGKDINRSFPGSRHGSLASQIAYYLREIILPQIDVGIDFHTGGARINNIPQIRTIISNSSNLELATAFSARFTINSPLRTSSLRFEAEKLGKPFLIYEGGESLRLRKNAIDGGVNGTLRVMKHLGMVAEAPAPKFHNVLITESSWIRSKSSGLYHSFARIGEEVKKGSTIGLITGPFGEYELPVKAPNYGYVLAINNKPVINRGDALMHVGIPA